MFVTLMCKMAVPGGWASVIDRSSFPLARSHMVICNQNTLTAEGFSPSPRVLVHQSISIFPVSSSVSRVSISEKNDLKKCFNAFLCHRTREELNNLC